MVKSRARANHFPLASVATYGPDDTLATKLVAAVIDRPGDDDPSSTKSWTTVEDVRRDPFVAKNLSEFLLERGVKETVTSDRILGCPHQEGIDYPVGRTCPHCPFWAGIDRFTHEPIEPPVATMSVDGVLAELSKERTPPAPGVLESADAHRSALVDPLLRAIERGLADPAGATEDEATLFCYALYLCAKWRETRAYPLVVRWLSLPGEGAFDIAGDIPTMDGPRILAAVCDGDLEPIKAIAVNRGANEYGRAAALDALALLAVWAEVPREQVDEYLLFLAHDGLEREPSYVWNALAISCADIEALDVFPELRRAYEDGLIDGRAIALRELDDVEFGTRGDEIDQLRERCPPILDVAEATAWWSEHGDDDEGFDPDGDGESLAVSEPYRAPPKVGRNEPCPCGSGKKYKKCCGA